MFCYAKLIRQVMTEYPYNEEYMNNAYAHYFERIKEPDLVIALTVLV